MAVKENKNQIRIINPSFWENHKPELLVLNNQIHLAQDIQPYLRHECYFSTVYFSNEPTDVVFYEAEREDNQYRIKLLTENLSQCQCFFYQGKLIAEVSFHDKQLEIISYCEKTLKIDCSITKIENTLIKSPGTIVLSGTIECSNRFNLDCVNVEIVPLKIHIGLEDIETHSIFSSPNIVIRATDSIHINKEVTLESKNLYLSGRYVDHACFIKANNYAVTAIDYKNRGAVNVDNDYTVYACQYTTFTSSIMNVKNLCSINCDDYNDNSLRAQVGTLNLTAKRAYFSCYLTCDEGVAIVTQEELCFSEKTVLTVNGKFLAQCDQNIKFDARLEHQLDKDRSLDDLKIIAGGNIDLKGYIKSRSQHLSIATHGLLSIHGVICSDEGSNTKLHLINQNIEILGRIFNFKNISTQSTQTFRLAKSNYIGSGKEIIVIANDIEIDGTLESDDSLCLRAACGNIRINSTGMISSKNREEFICDQVYNFGKITTKGNVYFGANILACNMGCIDASDLHVDVSIFVNAWRLEVERVITINALLSISSGVISSKSFTNNTLINFSASLFIPNIQSLRSLFSAQNAFNAMKICANTMSPLAHSILQLGLNAKILYDRIQQTHSQFHVLLSEIKDKNLRRCFYKTIPALVSLKDTTSQANGVLRQINVQLDIAKKKELPSNMDVAIPTEAEYCQQKEKDYQQTWSSWIWKFDKSDVIHNFRNGEILTAVNLHIKSLGELFRYDTFDNLFSLLKNYTSHVTHQCQQDLQKFILNKSTVVTILNDSAIQSFQQTYTTETIYSFDMSFILSANIHERSALTHSQSFKAALTLISIDTDSYRNHGFIGSLQSISISAAHLMNNNTIVGRQGVSVRTQDLNLTENSQQSYNKWRINTKKLSVDGAHRLEEVMAISEQTKVAETGSLVLHQSVLKGDHVENQGTVQSSKSSIECNTYTGHEASHTNLEETNLTVKETLIFDGSGHMDRTTIKSKKVKVNDGAKLDFKQSYAVTQEAEIAGKVKLTGDVNSDNLAAALIVEKTATVAETGTIGLTENAGFMARHIENKGEIDASESVIESDTYTEHTGSRRHLSGESKLVVKEEGVYRGTGDIEGGSTINSKKMKVEVGAKMDFKQSHAVAQDAEIAGEMKLTGDVNSDSLAAALIVEKTATVTKTGTVGLAENAGFKAGHIRHEGRIEGSQSAIECDTHTEYKGCQTNLEKTSFTAKKDISFAGNLNIRESAIKSGGKVSIERSGAVKSRNSELTAQEFTHHGNIDSKECLKIKVGKTLETSDESKISAEKLLIDSGSITHHGQAEVTEGLYVSSDSLWNYGNIKTRNGAQYDINHYMINRGYIDGDHTTVNAGLYLNMWNVHSSDSLTINAGASFNIGLMRSMHINNNAFIRFNTGLYLPALPSSSDSLFNASNLYGVSKTLLYNVSPRLSDAIDIPWKLYSAAKQGNHLYDTVLKKGYKIGRSILNDGLSSVKTSELISLAVGLKDVSNYAKERYLDISSLASGIKDIGNYAVKRLESSDSLADSIWDISSHACTTFTDNQHDSYQGNIMLSIADQFGPSISNCNVFSANYGGMLSHNISERGFYNKNAGVIYVSNAFSSNTSFSDNSGYVSGQRVFYSGKTLDTTGTIYGRSRLGLKIDDLSVEAGKVSGSNATILTKNMPIRTAATVELTGHSNLTVTRQLNAEGKLLLQSQSMSQVHEANISGNVSLETSSQMRVEKTATVTETGKVKLSKKAGFKARHIEHKGEIDASQSGIECDAYSANAGSQTHLEKTRITAKNNLVLKSGAKVHVNNVEIDTNNADISARIEVENALAIRAGDSLTLNKEGSFDGDNGHVSVRAKNHRLEGHVGTDTFAIEADEIKDLNDFLNGRRFYQRIQPKTNLVVKTKQSANLNSGINSKCGVELHASTILVSADIHSGKYLSFEAEDGEFKINASIDAVGPIIFKSKGDLTNLGQTIASKGSHVALISEGNVVNTCRTYEVNGPHDAITYFIPGRVLAGSGDDNIGVHIQAGGKVINEASQIMGDGDNIIYAEQGFENRQRSHNYVSKVEKKKVLWGLIKKTKTVETAVNTQDATVTSTNGFNTIYTPTGGITSLASSFLAKKGTDLFARDKIKLHGVKHTHQRLTEKHYLGGLLGSTKKESHESVTPTLIYDAGNSKIRSFQGDIDGQDVLILGPGHLSTKAKNVNLSLSKLEHALDATQRQLDIDSFGLSIAKAIHNGENILTACMQQDPLLNKVQTLVTQSDSIPSTLANGWNTGLAAYNSYVTFSEAYQNSKLGAALMQRYRLGDETGFKPGFSVSISQTNSTHNYEELALGGVQRGSWEVEADNNFTLCGLPVEIKEKLSVRAKNFNQIGISLDSNTEINSIALTAGFSGLTPAFVGGSGKTFKSYETHYVNQTVSVGGELQLDVGHWTLDAANLSASDISGQCGQLKIISRQDERDAGSTNFSVCSNGEVGFSQASVKSRHTKQASGITILRKGDARETPLKLHVSKAELEGGTIVNNSDNTRVHIDTISARTIEDSEHSTCTGISTNIHSLIGDSKQTPKLETQLHKRDQIGTIGVNYSRRTFHSKNRATLFGNTSRSTQVNYTEGELNTTSSMSREVSQQNKVNIQLDVPILSRRPVETEQDNKHLEVGHADQYPDDTDIPVARIVIVSNSSDTLTDTQNTSRSSDILTPEVKQQEKNNDNDEKNPSVCQKSERHKVTGGPKTSEAFSSKALPKSTKGFNPPLSTKKMGKKTGARKLPQSFDTADGRYKTLRQAAKQTVEENSVTGSGDVVLAKWGRKADDSWIQFDPILFDARETGVHCIAKIDAKTKQFVIDTGLGISARANIINFNSNLCDDTNLQYAFDLASVAALANANLKNKNGGLTADAGVEIGVMGPSATVGGRLFKMRLCGLNFEFSGEGSLGFGFKGVAKGSLEVDFKKLKASAYTKVGLFSGPGACGRLRGEVSIDPEAVEAVKEVHQQLADNLQQECDADSFSRSIANKLEAHQPLLPFESESFDDMVSRAIIKTCINYFCSESENDNMPRSMAQSNI